MQLTTTTTTSSGPRHLGLVHALGADAAIGQPPWLEHPDLSIVEE